MPRALLEGAAVCGGVISGSVRVVTDPQAGVEVEPGEILVVPHSSPEYAIGLMQAAGVICEYGGVLSHICSVAMELGIPCITEAPNATSILRTAMKVTLDADRGVVYED
jgi:rifampicin phosphotransferase